jgi:uncharacterized protein (DUF433 family)
MKMPATRGSEASGRSYDLIGIGLYTIPEAHRLTNVPISNIRRWTLGYAYVFGGVTHMSPAIVRPQIDPIDGTIVLGFRDLQEIRFLDAFRKHGVSWHTLRLAFERARELTRSSHPFSTGQFRSSGNAIFTAVARETNDPELLDIVKGQLAFRKILAPYLRGLDYEGDEPVRWYPEDRRRVVLDPGRRFGQPIVNKEGVPTRILARSYKREHSYRVVAHWYDVAIESVKAAVAFEKRLAAA